MSSLSLNWFSLDGIRSFFMGKVYPAFICFIVALGSITGLEFYIAMLHILLAVSALCICRSIKPTVISFLTFVMQISVGNSPFYPGYSDYYYTGWRLPIVIIMAALAIFGLTFFVIRNRIYKKVSFKKSPLLLSLILVFAAFLLNGVFSGKWQMGNIVFGFSNAIVFCVLPLLFYHGFADDEDSDGIAGYFAYISMLIAFVIISELAALFLTSDNIFVDGSINKVGVALGWGIWNLVGVSLSVLIPVIFYGVHNNKYPWLYFTAATFTWIFAILTMSRNALIFASLAYAVCVLISCFKGKNKNVFRIITILGVCAVAVIIIAFWNKIYSLLGDYFDRGFSDNGRYLLWREALKNFLADPVFGGGFYGFDVDDTLLYSFGPLAKQAHNTVLQLLSATGVVGFLAYVYYRYSTLKIMFRRPDLKKTFMAISIAVLLFGSLLDNFVFNIYPMFYYTMALTVIMRSDNESKKVM